MNKQNLLIVLLWAGVLCSSRGQTPTFKAPQIKPGEGYRLAYTYAKPREIPTEPERARQMERDIKISPRLESKMVRVAANATEILVQWEGGVKTPAYELGKFVIYRRPYPPKSYLSASVPGADPVARDFEGGFAELRAFKGATPREAKLRNRDCLLYEISREDGGDARLWVDPATFWPIQLEEGDRTATFEKISNGPTQLDVPSEYSAMLDYMFRNTDQP